MDIAEQLGTFTIDVAQEHQQDIFDLEAAMDQLVDGLMDEDVPIYVWDAIAMLRMTLDTMQFRATITPSMIHKFAPNTHQSTNDVVDVDEK